MPLPPLAGPVLAAATVSVALHLRAEYCGPRWQVYLFKPLTTTLLIGLAGFSTSAHGMRYQAAIVVGLVCSLAGDIFLMLPRDRFMAGLGSFLVAHLAYLAAFSSGVPLGTAPALAAPLVALSVPLLWLLWPRLGSLRTPVLCYTGAIVVMVWQAVAWRWTVPTPGSALAAGGALLFMTSDAVLALNRFRRPFGGAQVLIMSTYVAAQALIACSVGVP